MRARTFGGGQVYDLKDSKARARAPGALYQYAQLTNITWFSAFFYGVLAPHKSRTNGLSESLIECWAH